MLEYQNSLQVEILKAGYEDIKKILETGLEAKSKFIEAQWQKDLTESAVKRINLETQHLKNCIGLLDAADNLIRSLEEEIQTERVNHYMKCNYLIGMRQVDKTLREVNELKRANDAKG